METEIGELLSASNLTLSVAESCTAGGLSARISSIPGSSHYFMGGIIPYSIDSKVRDLNVKIEDIEKYSDVSKEIARQMSIGLRERFKTDFAISTTGYAGPTGKDVGKIFISLSTSAKTIVEEHMFSGNREEICNQAIEASLKMLLSEIK